MQPLLALSRLRRLKIMREADGVEATELQQLSNLPSLADLHLTYRHANQHGAAMTAAWRTLPVKALELRTSSAESALDSSVQATQLQLGALTGLTRLISDGLMPQAPNDDGGCSVPKVSLEATPAQLAAALQPLTALRQLVETHFKSMRCDSELGDVEGLHPSAAGVAAFVEVNVVCCLPELTQLQVLLPVHGRNARERDSMELANRALWHFAQQHLDRLVPFIGRNTLDMYTVQYGTDSIHGTGTVLADGVGPAMVQARIYMQGCYSCC